MKYTPKNLKKLLENQVLQISGSASLYCKNPDKDFTRNRKLPFEKVIKFMLTKSGKSLNCELMDFFNFSSEMPTASAFIQQRDKIYYSAFEELFHRFTRSVNEEKTYRGYRLLAVDGSDLHVPTNETETESYYPGKNGQKPYNLLHLNALYDLQRHIYVDAVVQGKGNEHKAFVSMIDRNVSSVPAIYIADRGYGAYNNMAHIIEQGNKFLIRIKDIRSKGSMLSGRELPSADEFDIDAVFNLTRKQTQKYKNPRFKFIPQNVKFDFLPAKSKKSVDMKPYTMKLRFARFKVSDDSYELVVTNLDRASFPAAKLKELYHMRWGIETSFRTLKYTLALLYFHSKKTEHILQEIFAKLTMYNFVELIISHTIIKQKRRKLTYRVNFSCAVHICYEFLMKNLSPPSVEALISKYILPVRNNLSNPRKVTAKNVVSFLYRIA